MQSSSFVFTYLRNGKSTKCQTSDEFNAEARAKDVGCYRLPYLEMDIHQKWASFHRRRPYPPAEMVVGLIVSLYIYPKITHLTIDTRVIGKPYHPADE